MTLKSKFWDRSWKYKGNRDTKEQFIFLHIPKTGGTTFRHILYNHFRSKDIYPTRKELKANQGAYLKSKDFLGEKKYQNKSMSVGHFHISVPKRMGNVDIKKLVFFRNPLDRILSRIKHIKTYDSEFNNEDVNAILQKNWYKVMHDQCTYMGYNFKNKNLDKVRQNILDLDFIGITEYFEESIALCNATFDWKLENIEPQNVIREEIYGQLDKKLRMKILNRIGPELKTYNFAIAQFKLRCKDYNIMLSN